MWARFCCKPTLIAYVWDMRDSRSIELPMRKRLWWRRVGRRKTSNVRTPAKVLLAVIAGSSVTSAVTYLCALVSRDGAACAAAAPKTTMAAVVATCGRRDSTIANEWKGRINCWYYALYPKTLQTYVFIKTNQLCVPDTFLLLKLLLLLERMSQDGVTATVVWTMTRHKGPAGSRQTNGW